MDPVCAAHFQELILLAFPGIVELDLPENTSLNGIMCERKKSLVRGSSRHSFSKISGLNPTVLFLSGSVFLGGLVLLGRQKSKDPCKKPVTSRTIEKDQPKSLPETVTQNFGSSNRAPCPGKFKGHQISKDPCKKPVASRPIKKDQPKLILTVPETVTQNFGSSARAPSSGKFKVVPLAPKTTASNEGSPELPKTENQKPVVLREASSASDSNAVPKLVNSSAPNEASSATDSNESTNSIPFWDQCWDINLNALEGNKWIGIGSLPNEDFIERWGEGEIWIRNYDRERDEYVDTKKKTLRETVSKIGFYINPRVWKESKNGEEILATLRSSIKEKPKDSDEKANFIQSVLIRFQGIEITFHYGSRFWLPSSMVAVFQSKLAASSHETWKSLPEEKRKEFGEKICKSSSDFIWDLMKDLDSAVVVDWDLFV